ncbi:50S ribosomal protein L32 [soil metagenome]|jgi:large subunit ribosomal protein L32
MAHPKRKTSKTRRDKRRTHYKGTIATFMECSNCSNPVLYHRVCTECGYYKGKPAIEKELAV